MQKVTGLAQTKALATEAIQTRWKPMCEAEKIEEMEFVITHSECPFCRVILQNGADCKACPVGTDEGCCNGLWRQFDYALYNKYFATARNVAEQIREFLEAYTEE